MDFFKWVPYLYGSTNRSGSIKQASFWLIDLVKYSLEEVIFAEELSCAGKAFVCQGRIAITAFEALGVPSPFQHLQDEPVQDQIAATATLRNARCAQTQAFVTY